MGPDDQNSQTMLVPATTVGVTVPIDAQDPEVPMEVFGCDDLPIVFEVPGVAIRSTEVGGMTVSFYRLPAGDLRPILEGLPGDACPCPHWGYVISGRLRLHTGTETHDVEAGHGYYVEPGHTAETIEPTEAFEVSPTPQSLAVWEHFKTRLLQA